MTRHAPQEGADADRAFRRTFADAGALLPALTALYRRRAGRRGGNDPTPNPANPGTPSTGEAPERAGSGGSSVRVPTPEQEAGAEPALPASSRPSGCSDAWWAALQEVRLQLLEVSSCGAFAHVHGPLLPLQNNSAGVHVPCFSTFIIGRQDNCHSISFSQLMCRHMLPCPSVQL